MRARKTSWESVSGRVQVSFDDVLVCSSESLPSELVRQLEPWDLGELRSFQPSYLSGFLAERHRVDLQEGVQGAKQQISRQIAQAVRCDIGGTSSGSIRRGPSITTCDSRCCFYRFGSPVSDIKTKCTGSSSTPERESRRESVRIVWPRYPSPSSLRWASWASYLGYCSHR